MTEELTDRLGREADIIQARTPDPSTVACPRCSTPATIAGRFLVAVTDGALAYPFCGPCVDQQAPTLGSAVKGLNLLAEALPHVGWRYYLRCSNALHLLTKEVVAAASEEDVRREYLRQGPEVQRAVKAVIARQCFEASDVSIEDAAGDVDLYRVIDALAGIIAAGVRSQTDDIAAFLESAYRDDEGDEGL
jgi:hypothetical protein